MRQACLLMSAMIALAGCGPLYRTTYGYTPPSDRLGRLCSAQCGTTRELCRANAQQRAQSEYTQCETRAQQYYYQCLNAAGSAEQRQSCFLSQCNAHVFYDGCDGDYRACYSACGGRIQVHRHCVMNCPDSPPARDAGS